MNFKVFSGLLLAVAFTLPSQLKYKADGTGSVTRTIASKLSDTISALDYLAAGQPDCSTDNTAGLQAAINYAASTGSDVYLPSAGFGKCYKFTKLYFYYDAALNPNYPNSSTNNGRSLHFYGAGPADDYPSGVPSLYNRTMLVSTDATGPALNLNGLAPGYTTRQYVIADMSVVASNTTSTISMIAVNTGTMLRNLTIEQDGSGHGVDVTDIWVNSGLEDVIIQSGNAGITAGAVGLRMRNSVLDGGGVTINRVTVQQKSGTSGGFDLGMQFGGQVGEASYLKNIDGIQCNNCISQSHNKGIVLGQGVKGATFIAAHTEFNNTSGMQITNTASSIAIIGSFFYNRAATAADLVIDGDATSNSQNGISLISNRFGGVFNYGIDFANAGFTSGVMLGNMFERFGAGTGTAIRTRSNTTPWIILHNVYSGMAASYDDSTVISILDNTAGVFSPKTLSMPGASQVQLGTTTQASLGTPSNGTIIYCSDCTTATACTGGGAGAVAHRQAGAWKCL